MNHPLNTHQALAESRPACLSSTQNQSSRSTADEDRESFGVDVPGLGLVRPQPLPATLERLLAQEEREAFLIELLFAGRELAQKRLAPLSPVGTWCMECFETSQDRGITIAHKQGCATGRVLAILSRICVSAETQNLTAKEAAPDQKIGRADDWSRSRGAVLPATGNPQGGAQ
jgi:hypothetical protein